MFHFLVHTHKRQTLRKTCSHSKRKLCKYKQKSHLLQPSEVPWLLYVPPV